MAIYSASFAQQPPPRVLVGFEVVKYEEGAEEEGVNEAKEEKGETNEKEEEEEEEEVKEEEEKKKEVGEGGDPEPAAEEDEDGAEQEQDDKLECAPLYVSGIDNCTEWKDDSAVYGLLGLKRAMLEGVLDVMEDPKSCGEDGDPANPLLLVMKLAVDEADAVVGAATSVYREKATDAGGWSPELGGMNRWLARYYKEVLKGTRPVIVQVHVRVLEPCYIRSGLQLGVAVLSPNIPHPGLIDHFHSSLNRSARGQIYIYIYIHYMFLICRI